MKQYDAIVIGTGQAGPGMASALAKAGQKVAVAEGYRFGGSCVNYGCTPTKTLISSAHAAHKARRGVFYGVETGDISINWRRVRERVTDIIEHNSSGIEDWLRGTDNIDVFHVYAHFEGVEEGIYRVNMGDEVVEAPQVFLNTGTRARIADVEGIDSVPWLESERLLHLDELPEHLIILGGSYIGLEMGQAFRRLGSEVTIIETSECVINREDDDVKEEVHRFLTEAGITIHNNSNIYKAEPTDDGTIRVYVRNDDGSELTVEGTHWLNAIGRIPNTDKLNLESVGVETNERGMVVVDEYLETTAKGTYALGDINGKGAFTHTSYQDYEIVRDNLLHGRERKVTERIMAYAMYVDPPLGRVGMDEKQARKSGKNVLMATYPMKSVSRAIEFGETDGLIKLLVDADTEQFLGATVLGYHGDDVIQVISYFMHTGASYKVMQDALPIHPTISEYLPTILGRLEPLG